MTSTDQSPTAWATRAEPGAGITYFTGNLAVAHDRSGLRHRASEWFALAERGLVILTQRRLGEGRYEYIATRTSAPMAEPAAARNNCGWPQDRRQPARRFLKIWILFLAD